MIEAGTILQDRYLVSKHIGAGGMGAVYVGTDQRFGSTVAIKETFFTDENLRKAFEREARLLNSLRHPALARVSDHFVDGTGQFLVMEYIPGEDLSELMAKRGAAFPISEVLVWADQLLDALDYLHTQEMPVVHRDIKPQNLKLTPRGQIILLDFGLAKGNASNSDHQTNTKSIFGYSRVYAPLEQIQGTGTDPRSDFYSLAATVYHLMTGVPPEDALTRGTAVLNGHPDPLKSPHLLRPEISPAISDVIVKAMALNANYRPSSAASMRALWQDAKNDVSPFAEQETFAAPAAGIFDQQTQVIGGENTAMGAAPTEHNRAVVSGGAGQPPPTEHNRAFVSGDAQISIPLTELTRVAEKKSSRAWLGISTAATAAILVVGCAAALYVYKPEMFHQNGAAVNNAVTEAPAQNDPAANSIQQNTEAQNIANTANPGKEAGGKTIVTKEGKATVGEKAAARSDTPTTADPADPVNPDAAEQADIDAKQKAMEQAIQNMVNRRLQQANIRRKQANTDDEPIIPPQPGVRVYPNLPPRKPYIFRKKRPNP
jgi:predicted Ser/Thr protein kinase